MSTMTEEAPLAEWAEFVKNPMTGKWDIPDYPPYEADYIGPSWAKDGDGKFLLPEFTLGWQVIKWGEDHLLNDKGEPWRYTPEQKRIVLWWYAVDRRGVFVYRDGILQRLKGWGRSERTRLPLQFQ